MSYSYFSPAIRNLTRAKRAAKVIKKFMQKNGFQVRHTLALELVGVLAGFLDWRSLQGVIAASPKPDIAENLLPEEFEDEFKPMANHLGTTNFYKDFGFAPYGTQEAYVKEVAQKNPGKIWSAERRTDGLWLVSGWSTRPCEFYVIANIAILNSESFEVALDGQPEGRLFQVTIMDDRHDNIVFETEIRATSAAEAREQLSCEIDDETSQIREADGTPYVLIEEVLP